MSEAASGCSYDLRLRMLVRTLRCQLAPGDGKRLEVSSWVGPWSALVADGVGAYLVVEEALESLREQTAVNDRGRKHPARSLSTLLIGRPRLPFVSAPFRSRGQLARSVRTLLTHAARRRERKAYVIGIPSIIFDEVAATVPPALEEPDDGLSSSADHDFVLMDPVGAEGAGVDRGRVARERADQSGRLPWSRPGSQPRPARRHAAPLQLRPENLGDGRVLPLKTVEELLPGALGTASKDVKFPLQGPLKGFEDLAWLTAVGRFTTRRHIQLRLHRQLYARYTRSVMTLRRRVKRVGGSLGLLIPRDFAEAIQVTEGSEVRLTLVGNQIVVEPVEGSLDEGTFRRAFAAVLRRHRQGFQRLADYDSGAWTPIAGTPADIRRKRR